MSQLKMDRIKQAFQSASVQGRAALIPFLTAGDPDQELSLNLFRALLQNGADIVEIGIPYSDPLADGPVIQRAALRSLQSGFALPKAFELTAKLRQETDKALVLFTYINPVIQMGFQSFFQQAANSGADGAIIPDLPLEESNEARLAADAAGIALIPLVTPTSGTERIERICQEARGFVYCVSSLGVTGERAQMSNRVTELIDTVKQYTSLPVAVGFGVSTPDHVADLAAYSDGAIVGSAFIRRIEDALAAGHGEASRVIDVVAQFTRELAAATLRRTQVNF